MDEEKLNKLAGKIDRGECVLFAGAGLTINAGGASWDELVSDLSQEFEYESPLEDNFEILDDLTRKYGGEEVHKKAQKKFSNIELEEPVASLAGLPWFSTFTTNFDTALETAMEERQESSVRTVFTDAQFELSSAPTHVNCVKLMGSVDRDPDQTGSMALSRGEYVDAKDRRSRLFDMLASQASNLTFLFVGYSFRDEIFTDMVRKITTNLGSPDQTYYALFPSERNETEQYKLESLGIEPIIGDLNEFAEEIVEKVNLRDTGDHRVRGVPHGDEVTKLRLEEIGDFIENYDLITYRRFEKKVDPFDFFKGDTSSLKPFREDWDFKRLQEDDIFEEIVEGESDIITISGPPASGKSFLIHSIIERLISENESIAIEIPNHTLRGVPDPEELNRLIDSINERAEEVGVEGPTRAVFYSTNPLGSDNISSFNYLKQESKVPVTLIMETKPDYPLYERVNDSDRVRNFGIKKKIPASRRDEFKQYVVDTVNKHKLPEISPSKVDEYLDRDSNEFLPVMYRTMDPARRSIKKIINEEYQKLPSEHARHLVDLCSISSAIGINIPVTVCRRYLSQITPEQVSFDRTFEIGKKEAGALITTSRDSRTNPLFSVYHSVIANHLCETLTRTETKSILTTLAESVDLRSKIEADFLGKLLIYRGPRDTEPAGTIPFSNETLEEVLEILAERQPARPVLHHLGILKAGRTNDPDKFVPILERARAEPREDYALTERKENILVTLANKLWESKNNELVSKSRDNHELEKILSYLERSREVRENPHAYHVHARILRDMAEERSEMSAVPLYTEAVDVLDEGLGKISTPESQKELRELKLDILNRFDISEAEDIAEELLETGNGAGYYYLAKIHTERLDNPTKALGYLDKAFEATDFPVGVFNLRIHICLKEGYENYDKLHELAMEMEKHPDFEETWETAFRRGVIYVINGSKNKAESCFEAARQKVPRHRSRRTEYFWEEDGENKTFTGKVGTPLNDYEGWIYNHGLGGWDEDIRFDPSEQTTKSELKPGLKVEYEIGFTPKGLEAWNINIL